MECDCIKCEHNGVCRYKDQLETLKENLRLKEELQNVFTVFYGCRHFRIPESQPEVYGNRIIKGIPSC